MGKSVFWKTLKFSFEERTVASIHINPKIYLEFSCAKISAVFLQNSIFSMKRFVQLYVNYTSTEENLLKRTCTNLSLFPSM